MCGGLWDHLGESAGFPDSKKTQVKLNPLERGAVEGDSPVGVSLCLSSGIPSNTEPLKFRVNLAGPPVKPKYSLMTDSGQVP